MGRRIFGPFAFRLDKKKLKAHRILEGKDPAKARGTCTTKGGRDLFEIFESGTQDEFTDSKITKTWNASRDHFGVENVGVKVVAVFF